MTNFTVNVKFTGLCGFVKSLDGNRIRVVLVNAFDERPMGGGYHHHPHEPLLLVADENLPDRPTKPSSFKFIDKADGKTIWEAYRLRGVDLRFTASPNGFTYVPPKSEEECPGDDSGAFDWIAKMSDIGGAVGVMKREAIVGTNVQLVLARLHLTGGNLSTTAFRATDDGTKIVRWRFENGIGTAVGDRRALAEEVALQFTLSTSSPWGIIFNYFQGGSETLVITPVDGVVNIRLVNVPLLNVLGAVKGKSEVPEHHFLYYYDLSSGGQFFPHPYPPHCNPGTGGLTGPKCPPALFAPSEFV